MQPNDEAASPDDRLFLDDFARRIIPAARPELRVAFVDFFHRLAKRPEYDRVATKYSIEPASARARLTEIYSFFAKNAPPLPEDAQRAAAVGRGHKFAPTQDLLWHHYFPEWDKQRSVKSMSRSRDNNYERAACSAELSGDYSVIVTGRALLVALDAFVYVSVVPAKITKVTAYIPSVDLSAWKHDKHVSEALTTIVAPSFDRPDDHATPQARLASDLLRESFGHILQRYEIIAVFEAPARIGILEESAFTVALSRAILSSAGGSTALGDQAAVSRGTIPKYQSLAALLLSAWHGYVSWATIISSSSEPNQRRIIRFDRRRDIDDIQLNDMGLFPLIFDKTLTTQRAKRLFERNAQLSKPFWTQPARSADAHLSVWFNDGWRTPLFQNAMFAYRRTAVALRRVRPAMTLLANEFDTVLDGEGQQLDRRLGYLMQLHQLIVQLAVPYGDVVPRKIAAVNGIDSVLGAKLACARGQGALLLLTTGDDSTNGEEALPQRMKELGFHDLATQVKTFDASTDGDQLAPR